MDSIQVVMSNSDPSDSFGQGSNVVYFCLVLFLKICQEALQILPTEALEVRIWDS